MEKQPAPSPAAPGQTPATGLVQLERSNQPSKGHESPLQSPDWWIVGATVVLVIVTALLAIFTKRLWEATVQLSRDAKTTSDRQATETQRALAVAEENSRAAKESARAANEAVELGNKQFIAAHRPKLIVRRVQVIVANVYMIRYEMHNVGDTPAILVENSELIWLPSHDNKSSPPEYPPGSPQGTEIASGSFTVALCTPPPEVQDEFIFRYEARERDCFFMGKITYRDKAGTIRNTAFLRQYDPATRRFLRVEDADYEYQD